MSQSEDPRRASLEYLKKLAKKRLADLKATKPDAKLADAQLLVAREAGFASWRKLKAEFDQRDVIEASPFFQWCAAGNVAEVRKLLEMDARLANAIDPSGKRPNWNALHVAVYANQPDVVKLLVQFGANVNTREQSSNASPLHFAANAGHVAIVETLLEAGADVHATDDTHRLGVIGWATQFHPNRKPDDALLVLELLLKHGAKHHVYSAIGTGELDVLRSVLESNPQALEHRAINADMTPLAWAISNRRYDLMELLIQFGADIEEQNSSGRTVLQEAVLDANSEAVQHLREAGAHEPAHVTAAEVQQRHPTLSASVNKAVPMISVADIPAALEWYKAIGFAELGRYWENNKLRWATMSFGSARVMLSAGSRQPARDFKLWFYTTRVDEVYELIKARQLDIAHDVLAGKADRNTLIRFAREINDTPYGSREFGFYDLNGYLLYFIQLPPSEATINAGSSKAEGDLNAEVSH